MPRWSEQETKDIDQVRENLAELLASRPQFPEVVGDRKILRFLRGHGSVEKATVMMRNFLLWREANGVDAVRTAIVEGGLDHPLRFPNGEKILALIPQLVISPLAFDRQGAPLCVDQYAFSPAEVLRRITIDEYIVFVVHCLEYRSLVVEQLSEQRERAWLAALDPDSRRAALLPGPGAPHGVLVHTCVIRDLGAVGLEHASSQGQEIIRAVVGLSSDNYPELMRKCFMVNTPWVFSALWFFIKGLLAARTLAKISITGSGFRDELERDVEAAFVPALVGGPYRGGMEYEAMDWDRAFLCGSSSSSTSSSGSSGSISSSSSSSSGGSSNKSSINGSSSSDSGTWRVRGEDDDKMAALKVAAGGMERGGDRGKDGSRERERVHAKERSGDKEKEKDKEKDRRLSMPFCPFSLSLLGPRAPTRRVALALPVPALGPMERRTLARPYSGDESPLALAGWL